MTELFDIQVQSFRIFSRHKKMTDSVCRPIGFIILGFRFDLWMDTYFLDSIQCPIEYKQDRFKTSFKIAEN